MGITTGDRGVENSDKVENSGEVENGGKHSYVLTGPMKIGTCSTDFERQWDFEASPFSCTSSDKGN